MLLSLRMPVVKLHHQIYENVQPDWYVRVNMHKYVRACVRASMSLNACLVCAHLFKVMPCVKEQRNR